MSEREKGAFVYKGAGRRSRMAEDAVPEQRLCDNFHVQMQRCLAARNHQEKRAMRFEPPARADPYRSLRRSGPSLSQVVPGGHQGVEEVL